MEKPVLSGATFNFYQDGNSCGSTGDCEEMEVRLEDAGGGFFVVLKTETGWSISEAADISELCQRCLDTADLFFEK